MVLMEEKVVWILDTADISEKPGQAEATLIEEFVDRGYDVVDSKTVRKGITQAQGLRTLEGDEQAAAALGLQHGAEYSIVGNAIAKLGAVGVQGTNLKTVHATVNARLIRNEDGRIIASASAGADVARLDEIQGGTMAIEQAARALAAKLDEKFRGAAAASDADAVTVNISGLKSFRHLDSITGRLEEGMPGVESVELETFSEGTARLAVIYRGRAGQLAGHFARERFSDFRLEPTHVTSSRIDLKAVGESGDKGAAGAAGE